MSIILNKNFSTTIRYFYVFNIGQCTLPNDVLSKKNIMPSNPKILEAEEIINNFPNPPEILINNIIPNPRYFPRLDKIEIQSIDNFHSSDEYYASLYHELVHSTGAKHRLARKGIIDTIQFGSENYSKEELVAEIGASFLCNISGIEKTINNSASYVKSWLEVLKNDTRLVIIAASQAQKAADYILNNSSTNHQEV